jgi:hypothetical protein
LLVLDLMPRKLLNRPNTGIFVALNGRDRPPKNMPFLILLRSIGIGFPPLLGALTAALDGA